MNSSGQGSSARALASFGAGQAHLKCWKVKAERPPPSVFWRDRPRGVDSGLMDILWLQMLLSSCWGWFYPDGLDIYLLTLSPLFTPHPPKKMYCDSDLLHCIKQCVWGCIHVSALSTVFQNSETPWCGLYPLNTGLDYCLETNAMSARLSNQRLFLFMLFFFLFKLWRWFFFILSCCLVFMLCDFSLNRCWFLDIWHNSGWKFGPILSFGIVLAITMLHRHLKKGANIHPEGK